MILIQTNLKTKFHDSRIVIYDRILGYILTELILWPTKKKKKSYFGPIYVNTDASNL